MISPSYLNSLPLELKVNVLSSIESSTLLNLCAISKEWRSICSDDNLFKIITQDKFGTKDKYENTWRQTYFFEAYYHDLLDKYMSNAVMKNDEKSWFEVTKRIAEELKWTEPTDAFKISEKTAQSFGLQREQIHIPILLAGTFALDYAQRNDLVDKSGAITVDPVISEVTGDPVKSIIRLVGIDGDKKVSLKQMKPDEKIIFWRFLQDYKYIGLISSGDDSLFIRKYGTMIGGPCNTENFRIRKLILEITKWLNIEVPVEIKKACKIIRDKMVDLGLAFYTF